MKNETLLFLGGPKHGERVRLQGLRLETPVFSNPVQDLTDPSQPLRYTVVTYRRSRIQVGDSSVYVMAPDTYSKEAVSRALADYLEGIDRP